MESIIPTNLVVAPRRYDSQWYELVWLELALSVLGLTVATAVINYGIYALFNYIKGIENPLFSVCR